MTRSDEKVVTEMLSYGHLNLNAVNANQYSALHLAVNGNELKLASLLVRNGADVNMKVHGKTALHIAAERGFSEMIELLIELRANANLTNRDGYKPFEWIARSANEGKSP